MAGQLITLPIRIGVRVAETSIRVGLTLSVRALELASEALSRDGEQPAASAPEPRPQRTPPPAPAPRAPEPPPAAQPAPPEQPAPPHVSEEAVLVEEFAEPGAEDGAGANIRIAEPWDGYDQLTAKEVVRRLREADASALAAVELYETVNRNRETVLAAVKRELRSKNGSS